METFAIPSQQFGEIETPFYGSNARLLRFSQQRGYSDLFGRAKNSPATAKSLHAGAVDAT